MLKSASCGHGPTKKFIFSSPIGDLLLENCCKGITSLKMKDSVILDDDFHPNNSVQVEPKQCTGREVNKIAQIAMKWLETYFTSPKDIENVPLPPICCISEVENQSPFTKKVWHALATQVPLGKAVSYGELAVLAGSTSKASRAVGSAMKNNPVSLIIPCHRVILSNGALGNYSAGQKNCVKQWLLKHEEYERA